MAHFIFLNVVLRSLRYEQEKPKKEKNGNVVRTLIWIRPVILPGMIKRYQQHPQEQEWENTLHLLVQLQ